MVFLIRVYVNFIPLGINPFSFLAEQIEITVCTNIYTEKENQ